MVLHTFELDKPLQIQAEPLTPESFAPFGGVISPDHQTKGFESQANYGTLIKVLKVAPIVNNFQSGSTLNWNIFRCTPPDHLIEYGPQKKANVYLSKVLERHPFSTQLFVPMGRQSSEIGYLVIVAPNDLDGLPDLTGLRLFLCRGNQSVTYGVGTWHAPMIALNGMIDFAVLIHENGVPEDDCQECYIEPGLKIVFDI